MTSVLCQGYILLLAPSMPITATIIDLNPYDVKSFSCFFSNHDSSNAMAPRISINGTPVPRI